MDLNTGRTWNETDIRRWMKQDQQKKNLQRQDSHPTEEGENQETILAQRRTLLIQKGKNWFF
jgi:hypothetical protein